MPAALASSGAFFHAITSMPSTWPANDLSGFLRKGTQRANQISSPPPSFFSSLPSIFAGTFVRARPPARAADDRHTQGKTKSAQIFFSFLPSFSLFFNSPFSFSRLRIYRGQ